LKINKIKNKRTRLKINKIKKNKYEILEEENLKLKTKQLSKIVYHVNKREKSTEKKQMKEYFNIGH